MLPVLVNTKECKDTQSLSLDIKYQDRLGVRIDPATGGTNTLMEQVFTGKSLQMNHSNINRSLYGGFW